MASINFYALKDDIRALVHFIFEETDLRMFESYSQYDAELREFRTYEELSAGFDIGTDPNGNGCAILLQLWSPSVTDGIEIQRIALKMPGHTFRYCASGVGLIQLYFGGLHEHTITDSHYGHWSEAGARQRASGDVNAVNWTALAQLSGRVQRCIRNKLPVGKLRGRPIFPSAFAAMQRGMDLKYGPLKFNAKSAEIKLQSIG